MGLNKNQNSGNFNDEVVDMSNYATKDELNAKADIKDIPTKTSQLTNDSNFLTSIPSEYITETELNNKGYLTEHQSLDNYATKEELNNKANINDIPTKLSELQNDNGYITTIPSEYVTDDELNNALAVLMARIEELEERLNSGVE